MSNSDATGRGKYLLRLPSNPDALVTVYDGRDRIIWRGEGGSREDLTLERGLYTVRVEVNNRIEEKLVRLNEPRDVSDLLPRRYTAAPIAGSVISHEYYSEPAQSLSRTQTRLPLNKAADSQLFIFIRAVDREGGRKLAKSLGSNLYLCSREGELLADFGESEVQRDDDVGYLAFSASARHGAYRFISWQKPRREIPIHLFPNFQTQVFLVQTNRPLFDGMRIFMERPDRGFHPYEEIEQVADIAMDALMNRADRLPRRSVERLLQEKFDNPIFGLIGAYLLIRRLRSKGGTYQHDDFELHQLEVVLRNLSDLVPDSADVAALKLIRDNFLRRRNAVRACTEPPMFRAGLEAIVHAEAERPGEVIMEDSFLDRVITRTYSDSPWSSWEPLCKQRPRWRGTPEIGEEAAESLARASRVKRTRPDDFVAAVVMPTFEEPGSAAGVKAPRKIRLTWIQSAFLNALESELSRLKRAGRANETPQIGLVDIAQQTRTTPRAVRREISNLDALKIDPQAPIITENWERVAGLLERGPGTQFSHLLITSAILSSVEQQLPQDRLKPAGTAEEEG